MGIEKLSEFNPLFGKETFQLLGADGLFQGRLLLCGINNCGRVGRRDIRLRECEQIGFQYYCGSSREQKSPIKQSKKNLTARARVSWVPERVLQKEGGASVE